MCFHEAFFCVVKCRLSEIASSHCDNDVAYPLLGMQRVKQDGWGRRRHKRSRNFCRLLGRDAQKSFRKNSDSPLLFQIHAGKKVDFRRCQKLGAKDHLVEWQKPKLKPVWMSVEAYADLPDTIIIR